MAKTLIYALVLVALGLGIYFFIFRPEGNAFGQKEAGFTIKDTGSIGKIFIATNEGESVLLERQPGRWSLNGTYKALPSLLDVVMSTLATQSALYPVPKTAFDNAVKTLATYGIKVEIYDRKGKKMTAFYIGDALLGGNGTNMMMEGAKTPYVVQIPLFTGSLRTRFATTIREWRDRTVYAIPSNELKSVSIQYEGKPLNSFVITKVADTLFSLKGVPDVTEHLGPLNNHRGTLYYSYFGNVNCEGYLNGLLDMDSIIKAAPKLAVLDLEHNNGTHELTDLYWMRINKRSKNREMGDSEIPDEYDPDRLYAVINNKKDTVMVQWHTFGRILRKAYEFYEYDKPRGEPKK